MKSTMRLCGVLAALLAPGAVLAAWLLAPGYGQLSVDLDRLPVELAGYRFTTETRFEAELIEQVQPDVYTLRHYQRPDASSLWLYVALYGGIGDAGAHTPDRCYPAQGWEIADARDTWLITDDGGRARVRLMRVERVGKSELVVYWFQPVGRWPGMTGIEQLMRVWDTLVGTPQYAFVRVSLPIDEDADWAPELLALARELAPHVRALLEEGVFSPGEPAPGGSARRSPAGV